MARDAVGIAWLCVIYVSNRTNRNSWTRILVALTSSSRLTQLVRPTASARAPTAVIAALLPTAIRDADGLTRSTHAFLVGTATAAATATSVVAATVRRTIRLTDTLSAFTCILTDASAATTAAAIAAAYFSIAVGLANALIAYADVLPTAGTATYAATVIPAGLTRTRSDTVRYALP